jgi:predicted TIM-barrel fold metal-dependent hydrolase
MCLIHHIGGAFTHKPEELRTKLSHKASDLIKQAFEPLDPARLIDHHVHVAGIGSGGTGAFVHSKMRSWAHPFHRLKYKVYMSAAGVNEEANADKEFVNRLSSLVSSVSNHGKHRILAFDKNYNRDGTVNLEKTEFYVPNEYVFQIAKAHSALFLPNISVNPYRPDAIQELERWAGEGARLIKWLPNAMGINPSDAQCDPFYQKMKQLDLILLSHGGEEKAVEAAEDQKLGNPLLLRRPLENEVKVIVAHCAGLGQNEDLDSPSKPLTDNFDLFMRLMDDKKYEGLLFGEISAMTQFNRSGKPLQTILAREDLYERLVNGSDYPLPAVNVLIRTRTLAKTGYITSDERDSLNEIYDYNPLLFDLVLKRSLKLPGTTKKFPASIFMENVALGV